MELYFNHPQYALIIPCEALAAIGEPGYIQLMEDWDAGQLLVRAVGRDAEENYDIPKCLYEEKYALAIYIDHFTSRHRRMLGWGDKLLSVEPKAVQLTCGGYTGGALLADLNMVQEAQRQPGQHLLPGWQMREFFEEEEDGQEEW